MPYIIGFAGGSGSGKTTAVNLVAEHFRSAGVETLVLGFDNYYRDQSYLTPAERAQLDYDNPDTLDLALLRENVIRLRDGAFSVEEPQYDFKTHTRRRLPELGKPENECSYQNVARLTKPVIIVDGLFTLLLEKEGEEEPVLHYQIFMETKGDMCLERRTIRDLEYRGRSRRRTAEQWQATVKPGYLRFVRAQREQADEIVSWDHPEEENQKQGRELFERLWRRYTDFQEYLTSSRTASSTGL